MLAGCSLEKFQVFKVKMKDGDRFDWRMITSNSCPTSLYTDGDCFQPVNKSRI